MNRFLRSAALIALLAGCGNVSVDGEAIGQAKKLTKTTNLFCPDYYSFDMSLGVMQNGTGSISKEDIWMTVDDARLIPAINAAVARGAVVKARYNQRRIPFCSDSYILTGIEVLP
jgi:hypothetical protein